MKQAIFILICITMSSCNGSSEAEKAQKEAEKAIAAAMEEAERLQAEAEAKAKALTQEAEAKALNHIEEAKQKRKLEAEAKEEHAKQHLASLEHKADKSLSKYNGFYVNDAHSSLGALIFVDGKLAYFDCKDFKRTYKNEEYNIKGLTEEGFFNIKAKYYKDRKGNVYLKQTVLHEGKPKMENGLCVSIERLGNVFNRYDTFKAFMTSERNFNYPLNNLISDVKATYNRSDAEIEKALNRTDFYQCKAYMDAEFYGDRFPYAEVLESIISM